MTDKMYSKSIFKIILEHTLTLFNILNVALAALIIIFDSPKNCLFMGVVICNTLIGILQELYARNILKKLNILSKSKFTLKDNNIKNIDEIVESDHIKLNIGDQIVFDGILSEGEISVDESFITGEPDYIIKHQGDKLIPGSFVVSGNGILLVTAVGKENYIYKIMNEGKKIKKIDSEIVKSLKKIIKIITFIIIPLSILIFLKQYYMLDSKLNVAIVNTVASILSMIPEGLILLTSTVAVLSVIKLNKYNILIQNLYATELLARTEVICFDKTGTLTTGNIILSNVITYESNAEEILNLIASASKDNNKTMLAIKEKYRENIEKKIEKIVPFDSKKKYMQIIIDDKIYQLGFPIKETKEIKKYQSEYRVLTLSCEKEILAILLFKDELRNNIDKVIGDYNKSGINVKVISGDDALTVSGIAEKSGLQNIKSVNLNTLKNPDYDKLVKEYNIFGRVTPEQKQKLIAALKLYSTVTYVGDGVNDVLALKEANTSITFENASEAAKSVSEIILLNNDFEVLPKIIKEGRRITSNIERSASLFLSKTIDAILLTIIFLIVNEKYPFIPIQITLIGSMTIGIPGFILSLEASNDDINKDFLPRILKKSLPTALSVATAIVLMLIFKNIRDLNSEEFSTISVLVVSFIGFINLYRVCKPFTKLRKCLFLALGIIYLLQVIILNNFYGLTNLNLKILLITIIFSIFMLFIYGFYDKIVKRYL